MRRLKLGPRQMTYQTPFFNVYHSHADFGSFSKDYYVINFGPRGGIVAVKDGNVLLARQYRFLIDGMSWELPGGTIEPGELLKAGAARECLEETGVVCRNLKPLIVYYPGLDNVDNRTTIWHTDDVEISAGFAPKIEEVNEVVWLPLVRAIDMIFSGEILDAMSIAGLLAYQQVLQKTHSNRQLL